MSKWGRCSGLPDEARRRDMDDRIDTILSFWFGSLDSARDLTRMCPDRMSADG